MRQLLAVSVLIVAACSANASNPPRAAAAPEVPVAGATPAESAVPAASAAPVASAEPVAVPVEGAAAPVAPPIGKPLVASLERGPCYGFCPVYKVSVREDGSVQYQGENFVKVTGPAEAKLDAAAVARLKQAFAKARFASFANAYETRTITDSPTAVVSFGDGKSAKVVRHYRGDHNAPPALTRLEDEIDAIVNIQQWIGTAEERKKDAASWRR